MLARKPLSLKLNTRSDVVSVAIHCHRCGGRMFRWFDNDLSCLNCGHVRHKPRTAEELRMLELGLEERDDG